MTAAQKTRLENMSHIGKQVVFKNKRGGGHRAIGIVEAEVYLMVADYKHVIQKIRFAEGVAWDDSTHAYRTGYWTFSASMTRVPWGQYTQFLTEKEYKALLAKARAVGWDVF